MGSLNRATILSRGKNNNGNRNGRVTKAQMMAGRWPQHRGQLCYKSGFTDDELEIIRNSNPEVMAVLNKIEKLVEDKLKQQPKETEQSTVQESN